MQILDRYIRAEAARSYALVAVLLLGLFAFIDLAVQFEDVGKGVYDTGDAILYTVYQLPRRLVDLTPFAALLAAALTLSGMASNSELVIMRSVGISPLRITASLLKAAGILLAALVAIELFVAPPLQQQALQMRSAAIAGSTGTTASSLWVRSADGILHIGGLRHGRIPIDIEIYRFGADQSITLYITAESADITDRRHWRLFDVVRKRLRQGRDVSEHLDALDWQPSVSAADLGVLGQPPESLSPVDLFRYVAYLEAHKQHSLRFRMALWHKLALPLVTLAMILLAAPLAFANPRSSGMGARLAAAAGIGLGVYAVDQFATNLGLLYTLPPAPVALLPALLISAVALYWLRRLR